MEDIFTDKNITESSKNLYLKNLVRLNGGEIKNFNFLKNEKEILDKLQKYKPNTQRTYIISIVSLLKVLSTKEPKKYKKLYDKYYSILEDLNKNLKTNNEKTPEEKENWISQEEVLARFEELKKIIPTLGKKITEDQFQELQKLLILSLYCLQKPRRNKDYQEMVVVKKYTAPSSGEGAEDSKPKMNILDLAGNKFIFNNFKTQKKYHSQEISLTPELREIMDVYLKYHPLFKKAKEPVPLLVDFKGIPYTNNNDMTRLLYKIFNKKIGCNMLRHIYLTDKYKDVLDEMKQDTSEMGTSVEMMKDQYIKN
jgi:hypothetical protein